MANVLIATLGESPIVISAMAAKLRESGVQLDQVEVLYPQGDAKLIGYGYIMLQDALEAMLGQGRVGGVELPFEDPNSYEHSLTFLRIVSGLLSTHQDMGDNVYLAISGGRKNMAALLSVMAQFFPCIRALLHILDRNEDDRLKHHFFSLEDLVMLSPAEQMARMQPPAEDFDLVNIPFKVLADAAELRKVLGQADQGGDLSARLSPAAETFYRQVFGEQPAKRLRVRFTQSAFDQLSKWLNEGSTHATILANYIDLMHDPNRILGHLHGTFRKDDRLYHFCKLGRTAERPLLYTIPNPIDAYPEKRVDDVIVCGISVENASGKYVPDIDYWLNKADFKPVNDEQDLPKRECILIAPLGESPMVVTQAYALLQDRDGENLKINSVVLPYFVDNGLIRAGAEILEQVFRRKKITLDMQPIGLGDLRNEADCAAYLQALCELIENQKQIHSECDIALLIAGGRKGMSALGLLAAQMTGVSRVYHTLVTDEARDRRIMDGCQVSSLESAGNKDREARLFPPDIGESAAIFAIPVIHMVQG